MDRVIAYVALGSNLGPRLEHLCAARDALDQIVDVSVVGASHIYETEPEGPGPQGAYLNAVLALDTERGPRDLLECLLEIELAAGRIRADDQPRWGPRTLDLDLLLYGDRCLEEPGLEVPHPRLHLRAFVLEPLVELVVDRPHPRLGEPLSAYRARCHDPERVRALSGVPAWRVGWSNGVKIPDS